MQLDRAITVLDRVKKFRQAAAESSGGTSSPEIKTLLLSLLKKHDLLKGSIIDVGAGTGTLLLMLEREAASAKLVGIDLFSKPVNLKESTGWISKDLNMDVECGEEFDTVICSETIEHLENPRNCFRQLAKLTKPGGNLLLTMPNNESIRSILGLIFGGHFTQFLGTCYPAHITALLGMDLIRMCQESGFEQPSFFYSQHGCVPKLTWLTWQSVSCGFLKGKLFSDNLAICAKRQL